MMCTAKSRCPFEQRLELGNGSVLISSADDRKSAAAVRILVASGSALIAVEPISAGHEAHATGAHLRAHEALGVCHARDGLTGAVIVADGIFGVAHNERKNSTLDDFVKRIF